MWIDNSLSSATPLASASWEGGAGDVWRKSMSFGYWGKQIKTSTYGGSILVIRPGSWVGISYILLVYMVVDEARRLGIQRTRFANLLLSNIASGLPWVFIVPLFCEYTLCVLSINLALISPSPLNRWNLKRRSWDGWGMCMSEISKTTVTTTDNYISCAYYERKSWVGCVIPINPILMHLLPTIKSWYRSFYNRFEREKSAGIW